MDRTTKGLLAIVACAVLWSTGGLFIKLVAWHPMVIAGSRSLVAAVFLASLRLLSGRSRKPLKAGTEAGTRAGTEKNHAAMYGAAAAYAATMLIFVAANKLTASANVILLQYSAPVYAALLGWLLVKEKPRIEHWLALAAVCFGLTLFFKDGLKGGSFLGDGLAVISGVTFGAYSVFMRMQKNGRPEDSILLAHIVTAAIGLPFALVAPPLLELKSVAAILALGIFQIGIASLFFAYGIRRVSAVQAMLTAVAEPLLNPVWVLLATGERPGAAAIAGGGVILTAVTVSSIWGVRRQRR